MGRVGVLRGYTLSYNTLDNVRNPTSGIRSDFRQDLAGSAVT
jgi:outer membrane protein assembly factor BamA